MFDFTLEIHRVDNRARMSRNMRLFMAENGSSQAGVKYFLKMMAMCEVEVLVRAQVFIIKK